jgi:hypothetical protein
MPVPTLLPEPPATPSTGELITAEIESWFALHRAKACLGEALEVIRDRSGVKIRGVVETAERREELLEALRGNSADNAGDSDCGGSSECQLFTFSGC